MAGKFHSTAHFRCNFDEAFAGGAPIDTSVNVDVVALARESVKAWKLSAHMPCADLMIDGFNEIANMSAETEAALNKAILIGLGKCPDHFKHTEHDEWGHEICSVCYGRKS